MFLFDLIVPRHCAFCACPLMADETCICTGCFGDLPWNAAPLAGDPGVLEVRIAMLRYEFPVDVAIKALKFRRKLFYAPAFAQVLLEGRKLLPDDLDAVLPVPLHWRRETRRGFNQAMELAKPIAKALGLPLLKGVRRRKSTLYQSGLRAEARRQNLRGAFSVRKRLRCRHVLIIDDVTTTGTTLQQLASTLRQSGVPKVSALTVAEAQ